MKRRLKSPADIEARCAELGFLPFSDAASPIFPSKKWSPLSFGSPTKKEPGSGKALSSVKDTVPTANSSPAKLVLSAASGCPTLRTTAAPGRWPQMRTQRPSTTWYYKPSRSKERPLSRNCAKCWGSYKDAENVRRTPRRRKLQKTRRFHSIQF